MAVKTEGKLEEETWMVHTLGRSHRPQFYVAQATGIRQAGAAAGTYNPGMGMGRWRPAGAGSGHFPGG